MKKELTVKKTFRSPSGRIEILQDKKTKRFSWKVISRNGYLITSDKDIVSLAACKKGLSAVQKVLNTAK